MDGRKGRGEAQREPQRGAAEEAVTSLASPPLEARPASGTLCAASCADGTRGAVHPLLPLLAVMCEPIFSCGKEALPLSLGVLLAGRPFWLDGPGENRRGRPVISAVEGGYGIA